jgi:hypothetical protein
MLTGFVAVASGSVWSEYVVQLWHKSWKTNAVALVAIWMVLMVASLTILSSVVTPFLKTLQTQNLVSFDWGGYSVASNALYPQPAIVSVSGSWMVPSVMPTTENAFSAAWIGIGGQNDASLIQVGTEQDYVNGQASYSLWYEMLPDNAIKIPNVTISPSDKISASITLVNSDTNEWLVQITDVTNGQGFRGVFQYNSSRLTAEWIIERPTVNNQVTTLANFGSVTFTEATAQIGTTNGTISSFPNYKIYMQTRQNTDLVALSDLSSDGSSFTATYA